MRPSTPPEVEDIDASLYCDGWRVFFSAWLTDGLPIVAGLRLPWRIPPKAFLDDEWREVACTLEWFDWRGDRIANPFRRPTPFQGQPLMARNHLLGGVISISWAAGASDRPGPSFAVAPKIEGPPSGSEK